MADHLTDEEQLEQLKNWWKENGATLLIAVLIGLITYFGFQSWQTYQQRQAESSSLLYNELLEALETQENAELSEEQKTTVNYLVEQLQDEHASSQYAINAGLFAAKIAVEDQKLDVAEDHLKWVLEKADETIKPLVSIRLARVLIAKQEYGEALELLDIEEANSFFSLAVELKGDIAAAREDWSSARELYQQAIDNLGEASSLRRQLLPIKRDNLPAEDS